MNQNILDQYALQLENLKAQDNFRQFHPIIHEGKFIHHQQQMLNLASNDYLGLAQDTALKEQFFDEMHDKNLLMSSSSSRLLTGNFAIYEQFEQQLAHLFSRPALLFNSGYHMNIGILPALSDEHTLILADKFIHASMIDGIRLSKAKLIRYPHQDLNKLTQLLEQYHDDTHYNKIIIVTESIFSMDGDETDLTQLVALKHQHPKVMLYVDDAHAIGVRGEHGLGCAEQYKVVAEIDILVGTFGKACASVGGYAICHDVIRHYLINTMRPLIFSTALPPINVAWSAFVLDKIAHDDNLKQKRKKLHQLSLDLIDHIKQLGLTCPSSSHIIPIILGENQLVLKHAKELQQAGFYIMPIRHPTVAKGQARLRLCLNASLDTNDLLALKQQLAKQLAPN